jgi:1-acyl-sn-glycerol-3-phosphate acyltransferase
MGITSRILARCTLFLFGWKFVGVTDDEDLLRKINKATPRQVIVYPHTSTWDFGIFVLMRAAYPDDIGNTVTVVWKGLYENPINAFLFKLAGCTPIENNESNGLTESLPNILKEKGEFKFLISPEGARQYRDKFRSGYYYIARRTNAMYNVAVFDYERHTLNVGKFIQPSDCIETDDRVITAEFEKGVPLHPERTFYACKPHSHTSRIDWLVFSNIGGVFAALSYFYYGYFYFGLFSSCATITSFAYHYSEERRYRIIDIVLANTFLFSFLVYRWFTGRILTTSLHTLVAFLIWIQAGHNCRYTNPNYVKCHSAFHFAIGPLAFLDCYSHS